MTKFISGRASTRQQTWARLLGYVGHWFLMDFGYWAIEEKQSGDFVGEIGFADFKRDALPSTQGYPELGFALTSRFHGNGYATEAVRATLAWADARLPASHTICIVSAQNSPSLHIVRKCGYEVFEHALYNEQSILLLSRPRNAPP